MHTTTPKKRDSNVLVLNRIQQRVFFKFRAAPKFAHKANKRMRTRAAQNKAALS